MTPETKAKIYDALAREFHEAGLGDFNEAMSLLDNETSYVEQGFKAGILIKLKKTLEGVPEPSAENLQKTLDNIKGKLRYELRPAILNTLQQFKKVLPRKRGGGRPQVFATAEQKAAACNSVGTLVRKGVPLRDAFQRVAREFSGKLGHSVSARTVQRAWQGRSQGY
jgi:hypothetical protein